MHAVNANTYKHKVKVPSEHTQQLQLKTQPRLTSLLLILRTEQVMVLF